MTGPAKLWFSRNDHEATLEAAHQSDYASNLRNIYMYLDRLRIAEAQGLLKGVAEAATALLMLPAPGHQEAERSIPAHVRRMWAAEVLGVREDASREVIEAAYRANVRSLRPETNTEDHERLRELNIAHELLAL